MLRHSVKMKTSRRNIFRGIFHKIVKHIGVISKYSDLAGINHVIDRRNHIGERYHSLILIYIIIQGYLLLLLFLHVAELFGSLFMCCVVLVLAIHALINGIVTKLIRPLYHLNEIIVTGTGLCHPSHCATQLKLIPRKQTNISKGHSQTSKQFSLIAKVIFSF